MPADNNTCFWHALAHVANNHAGSNKYTVSSLKEMYKVAAPSYESDFVPMLYSPTEYEELLDKRTREHLTNEDKGEIDVAHVISSELHFGMFIIDDTTENNSGYHVGRQVSSGKRIIIVRHGHAYVRQVPLPAVALEGLASYVSVLAELSGNDSPAPSHWFSDLDAEYHIVETDVKEVEESGAESEELPDSDYIQEMEEEELPIGVNKQAPIIVENEAHEDLSTTTSFLEAIQTTVSGLFAGHDYARYTAAAAPMVAFTCSLYTLFRGIVTGGWKWYDYVIHITGMVTQIMTLIASFWVVTNHATIASALVKLCLSALKNIMCSMGMI